MVEPITNCAHSDLQRIEGIYALTQVTKQGDSVAFNPGSGVPVVCFICPRCGEIKTYSAKYLKEI